MPTYDYQCRKCGHRFELFHSIKDDKPRRCPRCRGRCDRVPAAGAGILFKGSGFYITDHRSREYRKRAKHEKGTGASGSGGASGGAAGEVKAGDSSRPASATGGSSAGSGTASPGTPSGSAGSSRGKRKRTGGQD